MAGLEPNFDQAFDPFEHTTTGRGEEPPEDITVQALGGASFGAQNGAVMPVRAARRGPAPSLAAAFGAVGFLVSSLLIIVLLIRG